jgi:hypothetical protein
MRPPSTARQTQMAALLAAIVAAASEPGENPETERGRDEWETQGRPLACTARQACTA